ncbi:MAG: M20 family metallopeptidase [Planctomycetaceae bacterium]
MNRPIEPVELLQSLIRFPSVSTTSNRDITRRVAAILDQLGFTVVCSDYLDAAGVTKSNLIASRGTGPGGLAYFCHTDVVPADAWTGPGGAFEPVVQEDRIYGRGSCDMKGSLVAMLTAISRLSASSQTAPVHVICTADEEVGFVGAKTLVASSSEYRELVQSQPLAIVGEPTGCEVVHAHKGIYGFRITSHGRAAHSSTREGVNANWAMVPMLVELLRLYHLSESDPSLQDPRFDPPTLSWNFGVSDNSYAANIVPAKSEAWVSLRTMPSIDGQALVAAAMEKAQQLGLEFKQEKGGGHVWIDPDSPTIRAMCEIANCQQPKTVCYGTDGGEFTDLEHLVICGPGDIAQAHTADEYLSLEQLHRGADLYSRALQRWCTGTK